MPPINATGMHAGESRPAGGIPKSAHGLALAERWRAAAQTLIFIASSDRDMDMVAQSLGFFAPGAPVLRFPAWDCLPYDRVSPKTQIMAERMQTLSSLVSAKTAGIVVTTANALLQRLPSRDAMQPTALMLAPGQRIARDAVVRALAAQGYRRAGTAIEGGEFALRGSLMDIVPPQGAEGARLDFFGDEIESIRAFDPMTQRSQRGLHELSLLPVSEVLLNDDTRARFREGWHAAFGAGADDPLYEAISQGAAYPGLEHWMPLFYARTETLLDYAPRAALVFDEQAEAALHERLETIRDYYQARREALEMRKKTGGAAPYRPLPPEALFLTETDWQRAQTTHECIKFSSIAPDSGAADTGWQPVFRLTPVPGSSPFDALRERMRQAGKPTLLACFTPGSRERLQTLLGERGFHCLRIEQWKDTRNIKGSAIGLAVLPIETGFETPDALVLSEQDMLGERIARVRPRKKPSELFLQEANSFAPGELLVHKEHGIGRFEGLEALAVSGAAHDCLKLIYDGGDKLYLPVENIEMVSRYGIEDEGVKLDKLGGAAWQSRKARLKERILMAAGELLKIAAERQVRTAPTADAPHGPYEEFCSRFPYAETEDQARAIEEVIADLRTGKPMDRLICGDVGFGKTEVALRAAFVATMSPLPEGGRAREGDFAQPSPPPQPSPASGRGGMQVALIAPTTLLVRQHYASFKERFEGFGVTIRQLSRIVPVREQQKTRTMLQDGSCDIVIGTHALLAKQVTFKNLALLIVDEEQHFGVAQKEKLKKIKSEVHVLTLSATPIPRTLQMALTGVRDLSLITTPPVDRLAIRSFVMPFDSLIIKEAIERERHRGGQCFVVCPRIKDMAEVKAQLLQMMPDLKLAVAHGQMAAGQLDKIMNDVYDGKFDALLSTAIIESGLDIPRANTIIIHRAHLFGLSQLYQLRGRVGRGKLRAYAYFLLPPHKLLTQNATRRLEVMQTLDSLGAGFTLASHDMDIRGFGNLVGEEQSGHIREVGIELYQQMLEEAVASLKSQSPHLLRGPAQAEDQTPPFGGDKDWSPQINLGLPVLIPEAYVEDLELRLGLYRRAASLAAQEDIDGFAAELVDRFGPLPAEVSTLIEVLGLKILCKKACVERLDVGPKGAVITLRNNVFPNPDALLDYVARRPRDFKARPDQKLTYIREWKDDADKLAAIKKLAQEMAALAQNP